MVPLWQCSRIQAATIEAGGSGRAGVPNPDSLFRVLRLAVKYDIVAGGVDKASGKAVFWNNAMSSVLREDHPNSMRCDCTLPLTCMLPLTW